MKALSIRQPWVWLILNAGKDIENRQWWTSFRGPVLLHAAKGCTRAEYDDAEDFAVTCCGLAPGAMPPLAAMHRGGIVGIAEISDCVRRSDSAWFMGAYGFVLRDVRPVHFVAAKGALGFFDVDWCDVGDAP